MKKQEQEIKCPICQKQYFWSNLSAHFHRKHINDKSIFEYFNIITDGRAQQLISMYENGYSLNELCQNKDIAIFPEFSRPLAEQLIIDYGLHLRTIKNAANEQRCRKKYKQTCENIYGKGITNVSQAECVKKAKCKTFIEHYGVDNIWKCDWWNEYQTAIMLNRYGAKRISGFIGKTEDEKALINQKRFETKSKNGWYDSSLEERVENIMKQNNIIYQRPWFMYHHPYDFIFGGENKHLLLEINGDYWHANPKLYKATDIFIGGRTAQDIWNYDQKFIDCLRGTEWTLYFLWEFDLKKMSDQDILNFLLKAIHEN